MNRKLLQKAVAVHQQGNYEEAGRLYEEVARGAPNDPHVLHFQGLLAQHTGNLQKSIELISRAIALDSHVPDFYRNIALAYEKLNDPKKAAAAYCGYGNVLQKLTRYEEALAAYDQSIALDPEDRMARGNRSILLQRFGTRENSPGQHRQTIKSLKHKAKSAADFITLANCHLALDEHDEARAALDRAVRLDPGLSAAHHNRSFEVLLNGELAEGFREYEWRWREAGYVEKARVGFTQKMWQRETPAELGGPLLVVAEQGFGDHIHFSRYVPMLAAQGHTVIFEVQGAIRSLFEEGMRHPNIRVIPRQFTGWDEKGLGWVGRLLRRAPRPASSDRVFNDLSFSAWVGLMSLPERFGTTQQNIPAAIPYLTVAPAKAAAWKKRLHALAKPHDLKVGIVWAGSSKHIDDQKRSIPPVLLEPLLGREGITFFSLQKEGSFAFSAPVIDLGPRLKDFTDTAAIMQTLDLVISVDTAPAHLSGALGRPTWIMIPKVKDWRWGKQGDTSPWYPTARLFRQKVQGEWDSAIEAVGQALEELVAEKA